jgi:HAD superfamily hydrolase (TIGR01549 family)
MPRPPLRALVFDWDGTLWDSAEASYRSYSRVFHAYGIAFDRRRFEASYAPDWYATYRTLGLAEELWPEADARWMAEYSREERRLLPGAHETLTRLHGLGLPLGLVTSGSRDRVLGELDAFEIRGIFGSVVCAEDVSRRKPHPEGLLLAIERLGSAPAGTAYVGDSPEDVAMARAAGAMSVGIPGGFPNGQALVASDPDLLAASLADAVRALV